MNATVTLAPLALAHAPEVQRLAADPAVAEMTRLPHPYPEGEAERFIREEALPDRAAGTGYRFAVLAGGRFVGTVSLKDVDRAAGQAETGYWIGQPYWGHGYATEGLRGAVRCGFEELDLRRIYAWVVDRNVGSVRVLEKLGFRRYEADPSLIPCHCASLGPTHGYELLRADWGG